MANKKGSPFERDISRELSLWWSRGEHDDLFWRSDASGARAKTRSKSGKRTLGQHGDICSTSHLSHELIDLFVIELKRGYSKWSILDVLDKKDKAAQQVLEKFIEQVLTDMRLSKTPFWMIIARRDQRDSVVLVANEFKKVYEAKIGKTFLHGVNHLYCKFFHKNLNQVVEFSLIKLRDFFDNVDPEEIKTIYESFEENSKS